MSDDRAHTTEGGENNKNNEDTRNTESYQLFKTDLCGFCYRVRAFLDQHGIDIPLRDVNSDQAAFQELLKSTRRTTVPCLRIERGDDVQWLFESQDIMRFLAARYGV